MRPTDAEKDRKLKEAIVALSGKDGYFANPGKAQRELNELDLGDSSEVWALIRKLLPEIHSSNYSGAVPPLRSKEPPVKNHEMFAFSWESKIMGQKMYIKFVIKNSWYFYLSLHVDRPENK